MRGAILTFRFVRTIVFVVAGSFFFATLPGCGRGPGGGSAREVELRLATTTSTENSGLLDALLPAFVDATGIEVRVLSMGTGKALATARRGDCDVVLVHAPTAEEAFVASGHGLRRHPVMHNDFVIVGPPSDPAGILGGEDAAGAFQRIRTSGARFCSRGDDSGTHRKERSLWAAIGTDPAEGWSGYIEVGQGMGATLTLASERRAYTLVDRGTYLAYRGALDLNVLVEGDPSLRNPYSVIGVNPERHPHVDGEAVERFIAWLTGPDAASRIAAFRVGGEVLFHPRGVP